MKNHAKLCHGDFNPSNIIVKENGEYCILDWSHATQGNASADAARTFLLFSMKGQDEIANRYLEIFANAKALVGYAEVRTPVYKDVYKYRYRKRTLIKNAYTDYNLIHF